MESRWRATVPGRVVALVATVGAAWGVHASAPSPPPVVARPAWLGHVTAGIRLGEYHLSAAPGGGWTAPSRAEGLRAHWERGVLAIEPRAGEAAWRFTYELAAIGRLEPEEHGGTNDLSVTWEDVSQGRLEWARGSEGMREWYVNDERGIEQGFVIALPPAGSRSTPLAIDAWIGGLLAVAAEDGQSVMLRAPSGVPVLRIRDLVVHDAQGAALPACLDVGVGRLSILVDDRGAAYPLTIDPLLTGPAWTAESDQEAANLGQSVASAGDVNGDGYSDVIVGASRYDNGQADEGRAFVYLGSPSGLATSASWTAEGEQAGAGFGACVATAGDVNGDGYSDVVVGAPFFDDDHADEGRAFVHHGSPGGLSARASWTADGEQAGAWYGLSVATAGDVNGDALSDVLVGAPRYANGHAAEGRADLFLGSAAGLAVAASWTLEGERDGAGLGGSVATAGDVDGDGFSDVVVGADGYGNDQIDEGRAYLHLGSASGLAPRASWMVEGDQDAARLGSSVATAGDVNGDGYSDVIVGAPGHSSGEAGEGRATVHLGSASGLSATAAWTMGGDQAGASFGISVATAGDVNGDGYSDAIVGSSSHDDDQRDEGRVFVHLGSASGLAASAAWITDGDQADARLGACIASAGDVNGDGYSDVIVGAPYFDDGEPDEGGAFVHHGSPSGLAATAAWMAECDGMYNPHFGSAVAAAGDVNGDGYSDVVVGAPFYGDVVPEEGAAFTYPGSASGLATTASWAVQGGQVTAWFGWSLATAGDVNGDGHSDVIVGAYSYDTTLEGAGRAFVYHGSPAGLTPGAAWVAEGDQVNASFGHSVATAGDVNGDGYSDVVVGASGYDNGEGNEGRAYLYLGSAAGLAASAAWSGESDQVQAHLGWSVATAGDVNGDGYSDVIVGARYYDDDHADEGRAFVYHGSATGLATIAAWTADGDQERANFSWSVATAGDVNGDGYSDVVVGAPGVILDEGHARVSFGSASGLSATASWTAASGQPGAEFGRSVATAGDVNGDGYSDVIVGASGYDNGQWSEGRACVYLGSAAGLPATAAWSTESDQESAWLGWSVSTAGDVNGDGYSDVIVGANLYDNGEVNDGRAFVHYGNGDGLDRRPRMRRADGTGPLDLLDAAGGAEGFRIHARARSPFGRGVVRLEAEVEPLGTAFDGLGLLTTPFVDTGEPGTEGSFVELDVPTGPLAPGVHHWRVRLRGRHALPWQSHWMSPALNGVTETDLRAIGQPPGACCVLGACTDLDAAACAEREGEWLAGESCTGASCPTLGLPPGEPSDWRVGGAPLLVSEAPGTALAISYDPACDATDHLLVAGPLSGVSRYAATLFQCGLGTSGAAMLDPGTGSWWLLAVGLTDVAEGSYGRDSRGVERPQHVGVGPCDLPQSLLATCR